MKRQIEKLAVLSLAFLVLCACQATDQEQESITPASNDYGIQIQAPEENAISVTYDHDVQMTYAKPFNGERAWVKFSIDGGEERWGIINKEGKMISMLPESDMDTIRELPGTLEFSNGYSHALYWGRMDVYNKDGTLVYSCPDDEQNKILAYGEGYIYAYEDTRGFDSAACKYTIYDPEGNEINTFNDEAPEIGEPDSRYMGKGVFWTPRGIYFSQINEWGIDPTDADWISTAELGDDVVAFCMKEIPFDDYIDEYIRGVVKPPILYILYCDGQYSEYEIERTLRFDKIKNGIGLCKTSLDTESVILPAIYDFETDMITTLPVEYRNRWKGSNYNTDYGMLDNQNIVVELLGDDEEYYTVLFDKNWNLIVDPIKAGLLSCGEDVFVCWTNGMGFVYGENGQLLYSIDEKGYDKSYYEYKSYQSIESEGVTLVRRALGDETCILIDRNGNPLFEKIDIRTGYGNQNSNSVPSGLAVKTDEEPLNIAGEYGNESIYLSLEEYDSNQYTCNLFWNHGKLLETGIICLNSECLLDGGTQITIVGISDEEISVTLKGEDFLYENINLICWAN